jgi:hypothetical protein
LVVRNDGSLVAISNDLQVEPAFAFGQMKIHRFLAASGAGLLAAAIALDEHGQWQAIGISTKLEVAWTVPIGPQEFERQLQPIAELCIDGGKSIWAFASSDDTVSIISHEGKRLDNIQWPESIQGLALQASDDKFNLVVADAKAVSAVPIAPADSESHAQR